MKLKLPKKKSVKEIKKFFNNKHDYVIKQLNKNDKKDNFHFFHLSEEPLGKINKDMLKFYLK